MHTADIFSRVRKAGHVYHSSFTFWLKVFRIPSFDTRVEPLSCDGVAFFFYVLTYSADAATSEQDLRAYIMLVDWLFVHF